MERHKNKKVSASTADQPKRLKKERNKTKHSNKNTSRKRGVF
ncbi:MAG TPA: hypothetical protein VJH06_01185 [Candidatus Paceibacterota bacterium]